MLRENEWRGTHKLESAEGVTNQDSKSKQVSEGHSHTGNHKGRDK